MLLLFKECGKCHEVKTPEYFHSCEKSDDKLANYCKQCYKIYSVKYVDKSKAYSQKYYQEHKEQYAKNSIKYRQFHKNEIKIVRKKWVNNNPQIKLQKRLRSRLKMIMRFGSNKMCMADCTGLQLRQHIERQFCDGMTWANYGKWIISFIIPLKSFDLSIPKEKLKACKYTNIKPEWVVKPIAVKVAKVV